MAKKKIKLDYYIRWSKEVLYIFFDYEINNELLLQETWNFIWL